MIGSVSKQRWLGITVLVVTFLAGGVVGAAVRELTAEAGPVVAADRTARSDDDDRERRERRRFPYAVLGVEGEQRARIEAALEQGRDNMAALWNEYEPRMKAVVDSTRATVDSLLTPEQRQKYAEYRERRRQRQQQHDERSDTTNGRDR